ncbi:hypothetical protein [Nocardia sp. Marseille-Q1738]
MSDDDWLLNGSLKIECTPSPTRHRRRMATVLQLGEEKVWLETVPEPPPARQKQEEDDPTPDI